VVTQAAVPLTARDLARMDRGGVQELRFLVSWTATERVRGEYDWSSTDPIVAAAARRRIQLLPFVYGSPIWISAHEGHPPLDSAADELAWRQFLGALVDRYGPAGSFWHGSPHRGPITRWQIWNEPNFDFYWHPRPAPAEYARLLAISAEAIRARDPQAELVMGGLAPVAAGIPWTRFLRDLYDIAGFRASVDAVALHPYSPTIPDLARQISRARLIMRLGGEPQAPLALTEIGWASGGSPAPLVVGPHGQAGMLRSAFSAVFAKRKWRISDLMWYAWQDSLKVETSCSFCKRAGLLDRRGRAKPAWRAFREVIR